jgi:glycosyltransferase involved in cell wall biosynthesis
MKIFLDNVNLNSSSGPNSFAQRLKDQLEKRGFQINSTKEYDAQLSFIQANQKLAPVIQRLDGIYFNSAQNWEALNDPIQKTYNEAAGVVFQSNFNKMLTEKYFGKKEKSAVIHNGTDVDFINSVKPISNPKIDNFENIWSCASSWRPHKRLSENIRYFLEHKGSSDCLVVAGSNPDVGIHDPCVFYCGELGWKDLVSLYKRSKYFIHLALLDHCPNVVVDAKAAGCQIICAESGGTREIAGKDSIVIKDMDWDLKPFELYKPPRLNFYQKISNNDCEYNPRIEESADKYIDFFNEVLK